MPRPARFLALPALATLLLPACFGSGGALDRSKALTAGEFQLTGINVPQDGVWELNRTIRLEFNHPIDPASIGFASIRIEGVSAGVLGRPVTGAFEIEAGSGGRSLLFRPSCPTSELFDNGAFLPGGHQYQVSVPAAGAFGSTVLRDTGGHSLALGATRRMRTPISPNEVLFLDEGPAPPKVTGIDWPRGLNLYTDPEPYLTVRFDQSVDGRAANLDRSHITVRYALETGSSGDPPQFSEELPGHWRLAQNCGTDGAELRFHFSGLLPVDRPLRVEVRNSFRDIAGQTNATDWVSAPHLTPLLSEVYGAALLGFQDDEEAVDEFREDFLDSSRLDPEAALAFPPALIENGQLHASFDFASAVSPDDDLLLGVDTEIETNGTVIINGRDGRSFLIQNGVLRVDDLHVPAGVTLRARGLNPLVILVQGEALIEGAIDVGGFDSHWPTSLNSPQFPVGPVAGACGGGNGGIASRIPDSITPRGDSGDGPFGLTGIGGEGGEGGIQQQQNIGGLQNSPPHLLVGGGAGGTFALTANEAVVWDGWRNDQRPNGADNRNSDHKPNRHPYWPDGVWRDPVNAPELLPVYGGEDGLRGSSLNAVQGFDPLNPPVQPHGVYGMEDGRPDYVDPPDTMNGWDPAWNTAAIPFDYGHPTDGPDGGRAGASVFSNDEDTGDDFWGVRINDDGSATRGELLIPWAGSGGGASGDSFQVQRVTDPLTGALLNVVQSWPLQAWRPDGQSAYYRKGAPGGGGGGQLQVLAVGPIVLGAGSSVSANGGIGHGGESTIFSDHQVSGSGGGSGGHIVLHSATRIDLSALPVGSASNAAQLSQLDFTDAVTAVGGRRGWAASYLDGDGNSDLMAGRGGAGGNGVIQFHVPDLDEDLVWPASAAAGIRDYVHHGQPQGRAADPDRVEEVLRFFARPQPYVLVPLFAAKSQAQSSWIDSGLAGLREPAQGDGPFPDWADPKLRFAGIGAEGEVPRDAGRVQPLPDLLVAGQAAADFASERLIVSDASQLFAGQEHFLRAPTTLIGYDLIPNVDRRLDHHEVVAASYDPARDELRLDTRVADGSMLFSFDPGKDWALRPKFFRLDTLGVKDGLPDSVAVEVLFQGVDDPELGVPTDWTADLAQLKGMRFVRYRLTFDIAADGHGVGPASPRPSLSYFKLPLVW